MYSLLRRFGPATPTQLHRWTGLPPTTISAHLKRLDGGGTSPGSPNPADGRSYRVGLSRGGRGRARPGDEAVPGGHAPAARTVRPGHGAGAAGAAAHRRGAARGTGLDPRPYHVILEDAGERAGGAGAGLRRASPSRRRGAAGPPLHRLPEDPGPPQADPTSVGAILKGHCHEHHRQPTCFAQVDPHRPTARSADPAHPLRLRGGGPPATRCRPSSCWPSRLGIR